MPDNALESLDREKRLDEAVIAFLEAQESGRQPRREEWLTHYPEVAAELEQFFADQDEVDRLTGPLRAALQATQPPDDTPQPGHSESASPGISPTAIAAPPEGYDLLQVLGQGGMGIVYKARQKNAGRVVALKLIRAEKLTSVADVQRFRNEAEAAAQLDHPNIVPVYEVGARLGHFFFSMKLIEGGGLDEQRERYRDDVHGAVRLVAQVARSVHHAHQRGILHRDLKPSNILLDREGQPHVSDFGLAKRVEADASLTQTGAIVGTPHYMAPEQTSGRKGAVTTATDVYGLGTVLYALMTGRPPFQGETVLETLEQVREREPESPRRLNLKVDCDLETICLKCLQKEAQRRYESAQSLAEDLESWLKGEPILARPISFLERLVRWCGRNSMVASLVGTLGTAVLLGLTGLLIGISLLSRERDLVRSRAEEAEVAREEAIANLEQAKTAYRQKGEARLALTFERLWRLGWRGMKYGSPLIGDEVAEAELAAERSESDYALGWSLFKSGRHEQAERAFRHGAELSEKLAASHPAIPFLHGASECYSGLSLVLEDCARSKEAVQAARKGLQATTRLLDFPEFPEPQRAVSGSYGCLTRQLMACGEFAEADRFFRQEMDLLAKWATANPDWEDGNAYWIANRFQSRGSFLQGRGRWEEAARTYRYALELEDRHDQKNLGTRTHAKLSVSHTIPLGDVLRAAGRLKEANEAYQNAVVLTERSLIEKARPINVAPEFTLAKTHWTLGHLYQKLDRRKEAEKEYRCCHDQVLLLMGYKYLFWTEQLTAASYLLNSPEKHLRDPKRALELARAAMNGFEKQLQTLSPRKDRALLWRITGIAHYRNGDCKSAIETLEKARQLRNGGEGSDFFFLSMSYMGLGDRQKARNWYDQAVRWMDHFAPYDEELGRFRSEAENLVLGSPATSEGEKSIAGK